MKNLVQGDTPMDTYLDAFRKTHIDVHGPATDTMLRVPECVDGMADTHIPQLRTKVPHAMPPQAAARAAPPNTLTLSYRSEPPVWLVGYLGSLNGCLWSPT